MKYFIDTEFSERGYARIDLISIAVVSETGASYYAIAADGWAEQNCNEWVRANVLPLVAGVGRTPRARIAEGIRQFVDVIPKPEFWGYFADYDWVLLCQLFGTMMDLPRGWPMYCRDLKQWSDALGAPKHPKQTSGEHNALADARWNASLYEYLYAIERARLGE